MIVRFLLVLSLVSTICADVTLTDYFKKSFELGKSTFVQSRQLPKPHETATDKIFSYQQGVLYQQKNIDGLSSLVVRVEQDRKGRPVVIQKYLLDNRVTLEYVLMPKAYQKKRYQFPQDFMIEVPDVWLKQHRAKPINQVSFLGTHNSFANPVDGFLYFQQQNSIRDQFENGGVRMLRPAWHNPSGSIVDAPNIEPILCHADDDKCATSSLATRGFQPHHIVKEFNQLLMDLLQQYPDEIVIIGINNYLTAEKTDAEIEKVRGLSELVFTLDDLKNRKYQAQWGGRNWPTIDWMLRHNKRIIFLNDEATRYTIPYEIYVARNQYGTASINVASKSRSSASVVDFALFELSWFQNVSLPLHEINALQVGVELYWKVITAVPAVFAKALGVPREFFGYQRNQNHQHARELQKLIDVVSAARSKAKLLFSKGIPYKLINAAQEKFPLLKSAVQKIEYYVPVKQDNSLETLYRLVKACRETGVLSSKQIPNIVMLDFATTAGDGIVFVNLINMLMDQKLKIQFVDVGGFCYRGKQISTEGIL